MTRYLQFEYSPSRRQLLLRGSGAARILQNLTTAVLVLFTLVAMIGCEPPRAPASPEPAPAPTTPPPEPIPGNSTITFRSIPSGSEVYVAPLSDLGIHLGDGQTDENVRRLLGMARLTREDVQRIAGMIPRLPSLGKTPLQVTVPKGPYAVLVSAPRAVLGASNPTGKTATEALEQFESDSVNGIIMNVSIDEKRTGRFYVLEASHDAEELVQLWQKRQASWAEIESIYPATDEFAFDDEDEIKRTLVGNSIDHCQANLLVSLLRRGGKVVYPQGGPYRLILQVDKRKLSTLLRYRDHELVKVRPPAPLTRTRILEPKPVVETPIGSMNIEKIQLSDRFPPDCTPGNPMCSTGKNHEPMLILWFSPAGAVASDRAMDMMKGFHVEVAGEKFESVSGGLHGGEYFTLFLLQKPPTDFRLLPPKGATLSLSFDNPVDSTESKAAICSKTMDHRPGPPPVSDWTTEYQGIGELTVRVKNRGDVGVFVRIRDRDIKETAAQLSVGAGQEQAVYVTGTHLEVLMKATIGGRNRYFKAPTTEIPAGATADAVLSIGVSNGGKSLEEVNEAEFNR